MMTTRAQPVEFELLDGKTYKVRPLTIGPLADAYPKMREVGKAMGSGDVPAMIAAGVDVILIALVASGYQDMTREKLLADLVDFETMQIAFAKVVEVSGLKWAPATGAGNVRALTRQSPTGLESSATSPAHSDGPSTTSAAA
jgi:hypothetical protein